MKRLIALALVLMLLPSAFAAKKPAPRGKSQPQEETKNLGITTELLLSMFGGYLEPIGGPFESMQMTDKDKEGTSVTKMLTRHCTISIHQDNGVVKDFKLVSDEDDGASDRIDDLMMCFLGAILLLNMDVTADDGIQYLIRLTDQREEIDIGKAHYRFTTTQPFLTIIGLEVTPAE